MVVVLKQTAASPRAFVKCLEGKASLFLCMYIVQALCKIKVGGEGISKKVSKKKKKKPTVMFRDEMVAKIKFPLCSLENDIEGEEWGQD